MGACAEGARNAQQWQLDLSGYDRMQTLHPYRFPDDLLDALHRELVVQHAAVHRGSTQAVHVAVHRGSTQAVHAAVHMGSTQAVHEEPGQRYEIDEGFVKDCRKWNYGTGSGAAGSNIWLTPNTTDAAAQQPDAEHQAARPGCSRQTTGRHTNHATTGRLCQTQSLVPFQLTRCKHLYSKASQGKASQGKERRTPVQQAREVGVQALVA